ncbi:hypothetical protein [Alkalihalobacillus sp. LMS39]|uniref:hypothetical protein n=1 Tax=Alkalihalobacillus sp. LMS39 TaxID=2924032 RepID=UPI002436397E|nr:hypothetical protein [Alkalihalobacillus sp. LMS39]
MHQMHNMKSLCQQYVNQSVAIQTNDHQVHHGIIEYVDDEMVYLMVPDEGDMSHHGGQYRSFDDQSRYGVPAYGYPPYGRPPYGFPPYGYPGYGFPGYGWYRPRPFRRLALPLAALTAVSLLPFVF